jgi:class I fructose-bisphosphate aldolase
MWEVVEAGALGATIGRNVWGFPNITANVEAFKAVIHDRVAPGQAMARVAVAA